MTNLPQTEEVEVAREVRACINHIVFCGADNLARSAARAVRLAELDFVMIEPDLRLYLTAREEGCQSFSATRVAPLRSRRRAQTSRRQS